MKKRILTIAILMFVFMFPSINNIGLSGEVYAWEDCPKGMVNDEYPGSCPRYIDTDENGICDHSEPAPENRIENQNSAKVSDKAQSDHPTTTPNNIAFLSILIPLVVIIGYAGIYKIIHKKTS